MEPLRTDDSIISSIFALTERILEKRGTRVPGSQSAISAADDLLEYMEQFCHVRKERFIMHPGSQFNIARVMGAAYILSLPLLILGGVFCFIAAVLCVIAFAYGFVHFFLYGKLFDVFFRKKPGCNVVGEIEPSEAVKKQVIISGHQDSAHVFSFFSRFEKLAGIRLILAFAFFIFLMAAGIIGSLEMIFTGSADGLSGAYLITALAGLLFTVPAINFISTKVSPGAGDNLNGSSIAIHLGKFFAENKEYSLKNTRLIILSTDGEEAGQRGAANYVKLHKDELKKVPTYLINIDSIYKQSELALMLRDRQGFTKLSKPLADICLDAAAALGYTPKKVTLPLGSGTDAAPFARAGIAATSIITMSASMFDQGHVYHTLNDNIESIEHDAVRAVFDIAVNSIIRIDEAKAV